LEFPGRARKTTRLAFRWWLKNLTQPPFTAKQQISLCLVRTLVSGCSQRLAELPLPRMKSAYELAMERLNKTEPTVKLTSAQKQQLAELDSKYAAKIAEREIFLKGQLAAAAAKGDFEAVGQLEKQLVSERKTIKAELEEKKEKVRKSAA
jgi:hypothetical protein